MQPFLRTIACVLISSALATAQNAPSPLPPANMMFDVRNGDQQGKLLIKDQTVAFESLTDAKHSRTWKYTDIREIARGGKELRIQPFHGDKYAFQFKDKKMRDQLYDMISQRVVEARQAGK